MPRVPFALYDAFSETAFGGSQAGVVSDAAEIDGETRRKIAREVGAPAVGFVTGTAERRVHAQFLSPVMELPMCGHGTVGLMTRMVELGVLDWDGGDEICLELCLPAATAQVAITRRADGCPLVMLEVRPPTFRQDAIEIERLLRLLGLEAGDISDDRPVETAAGDFVHLVVPLRNLTAARRIAPDFGGLIGFCHDHDVETVAVFCSEVERAESTLHVRDFCPAVGVAESAAAGTTNAALAGYLIRHDIVRPNGDGFVSLLAEQGHEIGRPSSIRSLAFLENGSIERLQVGGVATKIADGTLHL